MESEIQQAPPSRKRLRMMVVAGGLVALAGLLYYYFWWYRPAGSGGAGPAVPAHSFRGPWTTQEVFLVGLGDSVTAGFGASEGYSYFERLLNNPPDEFAEMRGINLSAVFPRLRYTNLAMSGSTSLHLIKNQLSRLPRQPTNVLGVVVITTGGTDIIHDYGRTPPAEGAMYGATLAQAGPWLTNFAQRPTLVLHASWSKTALPQFSRILRSRAGPPGRSQRTLLERRPGR
jgi:lysophospholipase L1-like esterase